MSSLQVYCVCSAYGCGLASTDGRPVAVPTARRHIKSDATSLSQRRARNPDYTPTNPIEARAFGILHVDQLRRVEVADARPAKRPRLESPPPPREAEAGPQTGAVEVVAQDVYYQEEFGGGDSPPREGENAGEHGLDREEDLESFHSEEDDAERLQLSDSEESEAGPPSSGINPTGAGLSDQEGGSDAENNDADLDADEQAALQAAPAPPPNAAPRLARPLYMRKLQHSLSYEPPTAETKPSQPPPIAPLHPAILDALEHHYTVTSGRVSRDTADALGQQKARLAGRDSMWTVKQCDAFLGSETGLVAEYIDCCRYGCQAYTGDKENDDRCTSERSKPVLSATGEPERDASGKIKTARQICDEPRYKPRPPTSKKALEAQAHCVFLDPVPRMLAMFGSAGAAKLLRYFGEELERISSQYGSSFNDASRPLADVPHGAAALKRAPLFRQEPRTAALAVSFDGALLDQQSSLELWLWQLEIFSLPPSVRYRRRYLLNTLFACGPCNPSDFDSFARILYRRLYDAARGFWAFDTVSNDYFVWKGVVVLMAADLQAQLKAAGERWNNGMRGCPTCVQLGVSTEAGRGKYYPRAGAAYRATAPRAKGDTEVNSDQPIGGYAPSLGGDPAPLRTHKWYCDALATIEDATAHGTATQVSALRKDLGITRTPDAASLPSFERESFYPCDIAHLLLANCTLSLVDIWIRTDNLAHTLAIAAGHTDRNSVTWPRGFGAFPRNLSMYRSSQYKLHESLKQVSQLLLPAMIEAGAPEDVLRHLALFVRITRILFNSETATVADAHRLTELGEELNVLHETVYVEFSIHHVANFPLCFHRLLHVGHQMLLNGHPRAYTQFPLERSFAPLKATARKCPKEPLAAIVRQELVLAQLNILRFRDPKVGEIMDRVDAEMNRNKPSRASTSAEPAPVASSLGSKVSLKKQRQGDLWDEHYSAFCAFAGALSPGLLLSTREIDVTKWQHFATATLQDGSSATSRHRDELVLQKTLPATDGKPSRAHLSSYVLADVPEPSPSPTSPATTSRRLCRVNVFFQCPDAQDAAGATDFASLQVFPPLLDIYDGAATYAPGHTFENHILPLSALQEVVGIFSTQKGDRLYVLRKRYGFVEVEAEEEAADVPMGEADEDS